MNSIAATAQRLATYESAEPLLPHNRVFIETTGGADQQPMNIIEANDTALVAVMSDGTHVIVAIEHIVAILVPPKHPFGAEIGSWL